MSFLAPRENVLTNLKENEQSGQRLVTCYITEETLHVHGGHDWPRAILRLR
jgi:hypothetical protein